MKYGDTSMPHLSNTVTDIVMKKNNKKMSLLNL